MTRSIELATADASDVAALHGLIESAYRGESARAGWTHEADLLDGQRTDAEALAEMLGDPAEHLLVARDDHAIIGCVAIRDRGDGTGYLGMLTVGPTHQGGGLGRRLIDAAERTASGFGARRIEMTVIVQRADLIAWYERRGYRPTGERRPFPHGDPRCGLPRRDDLEFIVLDRQLDPASAAAGPPR